MDRETFESSKCSALQYLSNAISVCKIDEKLPIIEKETEFGVLKFGIHTRSERDRKYNLVTKCSAEASDYDLRFTLNGVEYKHLRVAVNSFNCYNPVAVFIAFDRVDPYNTKTQKWDSSPTDAARKYVANELEAIAKEAYFELQPHFEKAGFIHLIDQMKTYLDKCEYDIENVRCVELT